jgi:hypothetical protein
MKSVFRISRKGKVKPIDLSRLSTAKDLDVKLALIQALIPPWACWPWPESAMPVKEASRASYAGTSNKDRST